MKILLVNNLYGATARGGAERIVATEAQALTDAGHEVVVASLCHPREGGDPENKKQKNVVNGVREIHLPSTNIFHYLDLAQHDPLGRLAWHLIDMFDSRSAREFERVLAKVKPDVVHTHNLMGLGFLLPALLRRHRIRHVHTVHDVQLLHPSGLLTTGRLSFMARRYASVMRLLMGSPDVVAFPSAYLRSLHDARGFFPRSEKVVLPNPAPYVHAEDRPWPGPRFLFAGQLERHKGIHLLLDAWKRAGLIDGHLSLAGSGSEEMPIRGAVATSTRVELCGKLSAEALAHEYGHAAFTIVPSLVIENSPGAIVESFAAGTPVIAAAIGGIPELVREGETGFLFPPGDTDALVEVIKKASSYSMWKEMSAACKRVAASRDTSAHVKALVALYETKK